MKPYQNLNFNVPNPEIGVSIQHLPAEVLEQMNRENWASLESQKQYWIDKEAILDYATNETRAAIVRESADVCLAAVPSTARELFRANFEATISAAIERSGVIPPAVKLALHVVLNHVEPGWDNCVAVLNQWLDSIPTPQIPDSNLSATADHKPKPTDDLSRTESACDWFDHQIEGKEWSLRDDGRSDGQGESYAERNV